MFGLFNINGWEYIIIGVVALMVIGPEQLPTVMRQVGHYTRQFRDTSEKLKSEFMSGVNELDPGNWVDPEADPITPRKLDKAVSPGGPRQAPAVADEADPVPASSADSPGPLELDQPKEEQGTPSSSTESLESAEGDAPASDGPAGPGSGEPDGQQSEDEE